MNQTSTTRFWFHPPNPRRSPLHPFDASKCNNSNYACGSHSCGTLHHRTGKAKWSRSI